MIRRNITLLIISLLLLVACASAASPVTGTWKVSGIGNNQATVVINPDTTGTVYIATPGMLWGIIPWQNEWICHFGWEQTGDNQYSAQCNGYSISGIYHADSDTLTSSNFPDAIATRIRE